MTLITNNGGAITENIHEFINKNNNSSKNTTSKSKGKMQRNENLIVLSHPKCFKKPNYIIAIAIG